MITPNQLDFMYYERMLKGNYNKRFTALHRFKEIQKMTINDITVLDYKVSGANAVELRCSMADLSGRPAIPTVPSYSTIAANTIKTGSYTGNGASSCTVSVGSMIRAVMV